MVRLLGSNPARDEGFADDCQLVPWLRLFCNSACRSGNRLLFDMARGVNDSQASIFLRKLNPGGRTGSRV